MNEILGGKKPETIREFVEVVIQSLLIIWFQKFNLDANKLPTVIAEVFTENEDILNDDMAISEATFEPMELALILSENSIYTSRLYDGTPITAEKLKVAASEFLRAGIRAQFIAERLRVELFPSYED
ncbi:MAG: hypothetical protein AAB632_01605 [Patescibacteria group bacterium]